jgi:hypothetical protein
MNLIDRYEVREEELPSDEYDNEVNHWYVYDHQTDSVAGNEWFDTEKRAQDYLDWLKEELGGYMIHMDVIDKQIINDALKQYINYWQGKPFNGMEKRETNDFILRCENLRKTFIKEIL